MIQTFDYLSNEVLLSQKIDVKLPCSVQLLPILVLPLLSDTRGLAALERVCRSATNAVKIGRTGLVMTWAIYVYMR